MQRSDICDIKYLIYVYDQCSYIKWMSRLLFLMAISKKRFIWTSQGFIAKGQENKVCKFVKSLYGVKQAPKQWHLKFNKVVVQFGFIVHEHDKCIYFKNFGNKYIILCLYIDDILILETSLDGIQKVKGYLF